MTLTFLLNSRAEALKCKNTPALWLTVIGAAFIPFINLIKYLAKPEYFVPMLKDDPWGVLLMHNWQIAASFLMVIYIILVTSFVVQVEYGNNTWKQVYASPRPYADIFFSKFIIVHIMVAGCFFLFNVMMVGSGYAISLMQSQYSFSSRPVPWAEMLSTSARMYISVLAITVIQYWLSLHFRNFAISMGIGLGLYIGGLMIRQWEYIHYYPYMFPFLVYFQNPGLAADTQHSAIVNSLIISGVGTGLSFLQISRRRVVDH